MKEVYLLRHGEKDAAGDLTENGKRAALAMRPLLPAFLRVVSSGSDRTIVTAKLLTGADPHIDPRAAYATTSAEISSEISALAQKHGVSFLDAARMHNNPDVLRGIDEQAQALNTMIDELLADLPDDCMALVVSHDLTIAPAMGMRGMPAESINPLGGYIISLSNGAAAVRPYSV